MPTIPVAFRDTDEKPKTSGFSKKKLQTSSKDEWEEPIFNVGLYADDSESLRTLFGRLYRGVTAAGPVSDIGYSRAEMDLPTTREYLIGSTGYDFFDKKNRPALDRIVKHPITGKNVPLGEISVGEARKSWTGKRKQSRGKGYFLLGDQWVKATPTTLEAARQGRMTATDLELSRFAGARGIDASNANRIGQEMGPLYRQKLQDWMRQYSGDVSEMGIPLQRIRQWVEESVRRKLKKEKWDADDPSLRESAFKAGQNQKVFDFPYLIHRGWNPKKWEEVEKWMRTRGARVSDRFFYSSAMPAGKMLPGAEEAYYSTIDPELIEDHLSKDVFIGGHGLSVDARKSHPLWVNRGDDTFPAWVSTLESQRAQQNGVETPTYKTRLEAIKAHQRIYNEFPQTTFENTDYTESHIEKVKKDFFRRRATALRGLEKQVKKLTSAAMKKKRGFVKEYGLFVNKEFPDQQVWAPREEFLKQNLDTFVEVTDANQLAMAKLGQPVNITGDPAEQLPQGPKMRPSPIPGTLTPIAPVREMEYTESAARRGTRQSLLRAASDWAQQTGMNEYAKQLEFLYGRVGAQNKIMTLHAEHMRSKLEHENFSNMSPEVQAEMKTPFGGNFRKAHALGDYGFANWHIAEGFKSPSAFTAHILRVLDQRKRRYENAIKKGKVSSRRERFLRERIKGYENAKLIYEKVKADREGEKPSPKWIKERPTYLDRYEVSRLGRDAAATEKARRFHFPPHLKNKYGMLVENTPEAFLYAAYYNMFRRNPDGQIVPRDTEFQGLAGDPEITNLYPTETDPETDAPLEVQISSTRELGKPVSGWKDVVTAGLRSAEVDRKWRQEQRKWLLERERRGVGEGRTWLTDVGDGARQVGEWVLFAPGNLWKVGEGAIEGAAESLLMWGGTALAGMEKKDVRSLRKASPTEISSFILEWDKNKQNPNWNSWELNKIYVDHTKRDIQIARDMEATQLEKVKKSFLAALGTNVAEIVTGMAQLPSILVGDIDGDIEGRNLVERWMNSLSMAKDRGYQMGSGMVNFMYLLQTRGVKESFMAAPLDTLEAMLPILRVAVKTGKIAGKTVPPKAMVIIKKLNRAGNLASKMIQDATGVPVHKLYEAAERQTISTSLKLHKKALSLMETLQEAGANYKHFFQSYLAQREISAATLMDRLERGTTEGSELRNMAKGLRDLLKTTDDPAVINEALSFMHEFLGEERIQNTPALKNAFDAAQKHVDALGALTPEEYARKGVLDTKAIESKQTKETRQQVLDEAVSEGRLVAEKLAGVLEDMVEQQVRKEAGADVISNVLAPQTTIYHAQGVQSPARAFSIHSDWAARDFLIRTLRGKKRSSRNIDHANPQATIQELKRLRAAFERGKIKGDAVEWLFGEKLDIDVMDNAELGQRRLFHGTSGKLEDRKAMGSKQIENLALKLDDPKTRKRVRDAIDKEIERLEGLEPMSAEARSALGLKQRRQVDGGIIDDEFATLGTAKADGTTKADFIAGEGVPDIYVPKGTSAAIVGRKMLADPPVKSKEPRVMSASERRKTNAALREQIAGLKEADEGARAFFGEYGTLKNLSTDQLQTLVDVWVQGHTNLSKLDLNDPKALNRAATLANKFYNIKEAAYKNIAESRRAVLMGEKVNPVLDTFKKTLEDHGAIAAFNELFGHKDGGVTVATADIENLPGVLDMLKGLDTTQLQQILHEFRGGMVESVIGPKKSTIEIGDNISSTLEKYADEVEGAAVRDWWEGEGGTEARLTERALRDKNKRPNFVNNIVDGEGNFDLPPVLEVAPDRLIDRLKNNKESLRREARERAEYAGRDPDKAELEFELAYDNAIQRLRRYEVLDADNAGMFGVNPSDRIYVPSSINSTIKTMKLSQRPQGPVLSWIKRNLTSRNAKAFMNNLFSSVMLQFGRTGRAVDPFRYRKLLEAWHNRKSVNKKVRDKAEADFQKLVAELNLSPEDIRMMQDIRDVPGFLDGGNFEIELGGSVGFHKLNPLKALEKAYQFTDQGFKFDEAIRSYRWIHSKWKNLKDGETIKIEVNDGVYMTLEKGSDGTALLLDSAGKPKKALSSDDVSKAFARAGSVTADNLFGNYRQMSKALAWSRHPSVQIIGGFAPLLTWAYKATPFPGKKSIPLEVFNPYPFLQTNSKKIQASMASDYIKATARQFAAFQAGRERMLEAPAEILAQMFSFTPGQVREFLIRELSDHGFLGTKDLGWMSPWGPTQSLFRVLRWGYWELIEKGQLGGDNNKYFVDHWLGPKGAKDKKKRLLLNLRGGDGQKYGYSNPDGSLTEKGKKTKELRKYIIRQLAKGETYGAFDIAQLSSLTGPALRDIVNALQSAGKNRSRSDKLKRDMANGLMLMFAGGTVANAFDVGVGVLDRNNIFTSRRNVELTEDGESAMRFAIRRLTGLGFKPRRVTKDKKRTLLIIKDNLTTAFLGSKQDKNEDTIYGGINRLEAQIQHLKKINMDPSEAMKKLESLNEKVQQIKRVINTELFNLDVQFTHALNFYSAAQQAKKHGRKWRRGVGKKMGIFKLKRRLKYKDGKVVGVEMIKVPTKQRQTNVQKLYKVETGVWTGVDPEDADELLDPSTLERKKVYHYKDLTK